MSASITQCLPCQLLDGAGSSSVGPDLSRARLRDPNSIRSWRETHVPGFPPSSLPDDMLNAIVRYLNSKSAKAQW
jgi:hypothetical protein